MPIFYLDYENGLDVNDGSDWANAWKTFTLGATALRIAPGDIIRVAKSPAPVVVAGGDNTAAWTNLSKTVTLNAAETLEIEDCDTVWTADGGGDATCSTNTARKEGTNCAKILMDGTPQASTLQAFFATGTLDLSDYQKISFWIKNYDGVVVDNATWIVCLCSDNVGQVIVDSFVIPAIPSTREYLPLTIARTGGGNLDNAIESIAIYTGATAPEASKYILVDNFIACTTAGLNLQSLISKNSAEQGGTEAWYGIQSIDGVTVLLDNEPNAEADGGQGYTGTTETVTTYKRETIKTDMVVNTSDVVQEIMDSGTSGGGNIEFQGGYDTGTTLQTGETFFDGLNGNGEGIYSDGKDYFTLNHICTCRYYDGASLNYPEHIIITMPNMNNNGKYGAYINYGLECNITVTHANNNEDKGVSLRYSHNCTISVSNVNNNNSSGIELYSGNHNSLVSITICNNKNYGFTFTRSNDNIIASAVIKNNGSRGIVFDLSSNNTFMTLSTTGNGIAIFVYDHTNYIRNALIAEGTEVDLDYDYANARIYSWQHDQTADNHWVFCDNGTIHSQDATRHTAAGVAWQFTPLAIRDVTYVLDEVIAEIAVAAGTEVTVKCWCKKSHATDIAAQIIVYGGQLAGVAADVTDTKANDVAWEELEVKFTPTEAGVIKITGAAWYVNGNSDAFFDDLTVSQS